MQILIISDIHANLSALDSVLESAGEIDAVWCLGDLVGYGPDPNECVERVRNLTNLTCIIGNHDAAVLDQIDSATFNPEARLAIQWTQQALSRSSLAFLGGLPEKVVAEDVTLAHGSPRQPVWEYLLDSRTATHNFAHFDTPFCFVGHTHLPVLYDQRNGLGSAHITVPEPGTLIKIQPRAIINPGSVGQPHDRDPRAAYAIYDSEAHTWGYHRVPYDIPADQKRMIAVGLPERQIHRLSAGW